MQAWILYIQSTSKIAWWWNPHTLLFVLIKKPNRFAHHNEQKSLKKNFLLSFLKNQIESFSWLIKIDFENYHRQKIFFVLCWNWKKFFLLFFKNQISKFFWAEQNRFWKIFKRKKIFFLSCVWAKNFFLLLLEK